MQSTKTLAVVAALALLAVTGATTNARAESGVEAAVLGGVQVLNRNDTALPDRLINVPLVGTVGYRISPVVALEGEFTWLIPVQQSVELGSGLSQDRKSPDILAYQANVRASWPGSGVASPYLAAGAGALTILSQTDADRLPQTAKSQTMFALNFGAGVHYGINSRWGLRADFREFVAVPADDAQGLSVAGNADPIWMERGVVGVAYRF